MFSSNRYVTRGVLSEIPAGLQLFLWGCIDSLPKPCDSFQVFTLSPFGKRQRISHHSEQPDYHREYSIPAAQTVTAKIYVIDSSEYCTMLLADEY